MIATLNDVADQLEKLGVRTQILTADRLGGGTGCINVWTSNPLGAPYTSVWPPAPTKGDTWAWGHSFEHTAHADDDAATVANAVFQTLPEMT